MSILIKGMEMPAGCGALTLTVWPDGQVEIIDADGEWKTSEAVPVPPHGRLIDGDVAEAIGFTEEDATCCSGLKDFIDGILYAADFISRQPTIIEAEGE